MLVSYDFHAFSNIQSKKTKIFTQIPKFWPHTLCFVQDTRQVEYFLKVPTNEANDYHT